jgi:putative endonuclease
MQNEQTLIFIEVRYRRNNLYGNALESVNQRKQAKIIKSAYLYLENHQKFIDFNYRFDIIAIDSNNISWIKDAFQVNHI